MWCQTVLTQPLYTWLTENKIHGLDKEEVEFLDYVHDRQQDIEMERQLEEMSALEELRVFLDVFHHHSAVS